MSSKNLHQSAQGKIINMDVLRTMYEKTIAVGNMQVNARGDQVDPSGQIIKTRNDIMKDHYAAQEAAAKNNQQRKI